MIFSGNLIVVISILVLAVLLIFGGYLTAGVLLAIVAVAFSFRAGRVAGIIRIRILTGQGKQIEEAQFGYGTTPHRETGAGGSNRLGN